MNPDLDTLAITLYVTVDDLLIQHPEWAPERAVVGIAPKLSDAELVTLTVVQVLLRFDTEARFLRYAHAHMGPWFPYLPTRSGYNKRLRSSGGLLQHVIAWLATNSPSWHDDLWLVDSTPVECGRSRHTQQHSDLGGWAEYGYCPSHSRYFWGLRLHLVATPSPIPITYALPGAKADKRDICLNMLTHAQIAPQDQTITADKGYQRASFEEHLNTAGISLIRPATQTETPRTGKQFLKALHQTIESVYNTLKDQLGLERHSGHTRAGVGVRVLQPILALTTVIWHNQTTQRPGPARSLTAYDH